MNQPMLLIGEAIAQAAAIAGIGFTIWLAIEFVHCVRWYVDILTDLEER